MRRLRQDGAARKAEPNLLKLVQESRVMLSGLQISTIKVHPKAESRSEAGAVRGSRPEPGQSQAGTKYKG